MGAKWALNRGTGGRTVLPLKFFPAITRKHAKGRLKRNSIKENAVLGFKESFARCANLAFHELVASNARSVQGDSLIFYED